MLRIFIPIIAFLFTYPIGTLTRHLSDQLDNEIDTRGIDFGKISKDWVRISQHPLPVIDKPTGSQIELECEAVGSPMPTMQWLKGNTPITDDDTFDNNIITDGPSRGIATVRSRLLIHSAIPQVHEGIYTCLAESGAKIASAKSKVYIERSTNNGALTSNELNFTQLLADQLLANRNMPRIVQYVTMYLNDIGNEVVFPCKVIGNPKPTVFWLNPLEQIISPDTDPRITILSQGDLRIRNIRWNDMGPYTCVARNALGQDHTQTFLYPMLAEK